MRNREASFAAIGLERDLEAGFGTLLKCSRLLGIFKAVTELVMSPDLSWRGLCALPMLSRWLFLRTLYSGDKFVYTRWGNSYKIAKFPCSLLLLCPSLFSVALQPEA